MTAVLICFGCSNKNILWWICLWISLCLYCLGFVEFPGNVDCIFSEFGRFRGHYFFENVLLFLPSSSGTPHYPYVAVPHGVPHFPEAHFTFLHSFSLSFRSKSPLICLRACLFFCLFKFMVESFECIVISVIVLFEFHSFHVSFL